MAKIKDWSLDHPGQSTGTMTQNSFKSLVADATFTKNMERDVEEYLIRQERAQMEKASEVVVSKKIKVVSSRRSEEQDNWAYDMAVDNRLTLAI